MLNQRRINFGAYRARRGVAAIVIGTRKGIVNLCITYAKANVELLAAIDDDSIPNLSKNDSKSTPWDTTPYLR